MKIILFSHPAFMASQSMPRFVRMLEAAYRARGHQVQVWSPKPKVYNWVPHGRLSKWAGYIDQYLLFPISVRRRLKQVEDDHLFVFCDQALGPWVPLVKNRPHVVHVHDLLALQSALEAIPENPTRWSGKIYQRFIRRGFRQAKHFVSISEKTRQDLHRFGLVKPITSEVIYNGLNYPFAPVALQDAVNQLVSAGLPASAMGMLLHLSGGQWYKNLPGVLRLYIEYAKSESAPLTLWCIGPKPGVALQAILSEVPVQGKVLFFQNIDNEVLVAAYSLARAFLIPSLAEGFGWPIIEAQACGCPVVTTDAPPMNEVGGSAPTYLPLLRSPDNIHEWAKSGATELKSLLALPPAQRRQMIDEGVSHAAKFNAQDAISGYLAAYQRALTLSTTDRSVELGATQEKNIA